MASERTTTALEALEAALRAVEWVAWNASFRYCPSCGNAKDQDHAANCQTDTALRGAPAAVCEHGDNCQYRAMVIHQEYEFKNTICDALGYPNDPKFGWVTGDHTAETLLSELVRRFTQPAPAPVVEHDISRDG